MRNKIHKNDTVLVRDVKYTAQADEEDGKVLLAGAYFPVDKVRLVKRGKRRNETAKG